MNVRFFGGRKAEYISILKHNPAGLYFCTDSRELFLGDSLLSDGLRVVNTFADLPSISEHKAAEGVIYFVEDTKNGYVLPHGHTEWLQVIYAPAPSNGAEVDLSGYYTKAEVDEAILKAIADIEIAIDLTGLATEEYVKQAIAQAELADKDVDLSIYYTKSETDTLVNNAVNEIVIPDTSDFITIEDVESKGYLTEHQDLSEYAKKTDIPSPEFFVVDFSTPNYAKAVEAYNSGKILILSNAAPDVNSYATMNYVSDKYITFTKFLMSRSSTYGAFNTYYLKPDNTWEVAKEVRLNKVEVSIDDNGITILNIGKENYKLDYATNEYIQQQNFVTNNYIEQNYTTTEQLEATYITNEQVTEVVTQEVNTVVAEQIENKVTEVIQEKVDAGEITLTLDKITYGEF